MNTITIQETAKAMNIIAQQTGRTEYAMSAVREACNRINAGERDEYLNKILKLADIPSKRAKTRELDSCEYNRVPLNLDDLLHSIKSYPNQGIKFHAKELEFSEPTIGRVCRMLVDDGLVIKTVWGGKRLTFKAKKRGLMSANNE